MAREGYVKLHRKLLEWGWYSEPITKAVFLHLLLIATFEPSQFLGYKLEPGQAVFSQVKVAEELGISYQNLRTALDKLERTGEISRTSTNRFTIVTIENWRSYQIDINTYQRATNEQLTSNQRATNEQLTTLKNVKNVKNVKKKGAGAHWSKGWQDVQTAIRQFGRTRATDAMNTLDDITRETAKRIGWSALCAADVNDFAIRANFRKVYEQLEGERREHEG